MKIKHFKWKQCKLVNECAFNCWCNCGIYSLWWTKVIKSVKIDWLVWEYRPTDLGSCKHNVLNEYRKTSEAIESGRCVKSPNLTRAIRCRFYMSNFQCNYKIHMKLHHTSRLDTGLKFDSQHIFTFTNCGPTTKHPINRSIINRTATIAFFAFDSF